MKIRTHLVQRQPGRSRRNGLLPGEAANRIRQAILQGEFQPGDPLPELHLARKFGVSQAVVREALVALGNSGLVRKYPNKGAFVTSLTPEEVSQLVRLRLMLETTAWLDAAARTHPEDFTALEGKLSALADAAARRDYFDAAQADLEFHRQIWRMSGDPTLARLLDQVTLPLLAFVSVRRSQRRDDLSHLAQEHAGIVEALRRGDPAELLGMVRQQAERSYSGFIGPSPGRAVLFAPFAAEPGAARAGNKGGA